jgi:ligand-binding sensor domain-containing protein
VFLLACCILLANAESGPYLAQTWTSDDGLPSTEVLALLQSREGYLWIGTPSGLARFDGDRFVTFRKSEAPGLTSNRILSLSNNRDDGIWIGMDGGGLTHYSAKRPELTPRVHGISSLVVLSVCADSRGELWVGTAAGLNRWQANRFATYMKVDGLPDETVTAIVERPGGGLLVGTGGGLVQFNQEKLGPFLTGKSLPQSRINALAIDREQQIWIGAETGLYRVQDEAGGVRCSQLSTGQVVSVLCRADGETWFGTESGVLYSLRQGDAIPKEVHKFASALKCLLEDREGNAWAGTRQGLTRLKKRQFHFVSEGSPFHPGQEVIAYYSSPAGWSAEVRKDGSANFPSDESGREPSWFPTTGLAQTLDGFESVLWVGTSGEGLIRWDGHQKTVWGQREGLSDIFVATLCAESTDGVWVGTRNGGLNHVTRHGVRRYLTPWGFSGNYASVIASGVSGRVWIGTTGDGLFCLDNDTFTRHDTHTGLPNDHITALLTDKDDTVWAGTAGGLGLWHEGRWFSFTSKNGLPEDTIDQMQEDPSGNLWFACNQTIYRLSKEHLLSASREANPILSAIPYSRSDGLVDATMVPGASCRCTDRPGKLVFPTTRGLLTIDTTSIEWNTNPPPVLLQEVLIGNESVPVANTIEVPPGRHTIQFRYTALSYTAPEKVRFRCRLSGFDNDWVEVGSSHTMRYTRIPPGTYQFEVIACNNDGLWNTAGATLGVHASAFWWETTWFRIGGLLSLATGAIGMVLLRRQRRHELERLRVRIAGDLHDEIGSSLWSITLLSKMLQQDGDLGEEGKQDAAEIHRIATQTSSALRDIVWMINPGLDTLQDMVLRMRDFLSATVRGTAVQLHSERADLSRKLSLGLRQSFFLFFKEAVTNVAKHARAHKIEVTVTDLFGFLELRVRDDGIGFDPAQRARGHGIESLSRRAKAVRGSIQINAAPGKGTEVILRAPLQ